jgi:hypothetical protein
VFALNVADVGRAAVRLHPWQFLEIDGFAFRSELCGTLLGCFHQGVLRRRHSPSRRGEFAALGSLRTIGAL